MKHLMIDLETWGRAPGCAIRSIGAVPFELQRDVLGNGFYVNINTPSQKGLDIEPATAAWWEKQSPEAFSKLIEEPILDIERALDALDQVIEQEETKYVWSHGSIFDIVILEAIYRHFHRPHLWYFYNVRDTRTLFDFAEFDTKSIPFTGIKHFALDDAIHQAKCVQIAVSLL